VWGVAGKATPGYLVRLQLATTRRNPAGAQVFKVPEPGFDPRGVDIDTNGVVWTALAASSHLASFDVRKCKDLTGRRRPTAASARKAGRCIRRPVRS
jgi:streptogramin lyase